MAGNVREWCWNESQNGRVICGGAYNTIQYMYTQWSQLSPFDRSPGNGFRCALYIDKDKIPSSAFRKLKSTYDRDFYKEKPASDEVFRIYKSQFFYDKSDLDSKIEYSDTGNEDWILQKISYNAAYPNDRIIAYLFLPKNSSPPYQTMVYFPGTDAVMVKDLLKYQFTYDLVRFILKSGRAVLYPVYKGTYERQADLDPLMTEPNPTHEYSQWLITWIKDFRRSIDYIATRTDLDTSKIGYYGYSWGGMLGGIIPAVENRLKLCVLYSGGFDLIEGNAHPEGDAINYVTRIKIPILMLNGKYDSFFPYETTVLPFLNLLGTPKENKKCIVYETDHNVPPDEMVKETLNWLDKYFGPVNDR
jgi:cephalosporin-C deacetylase-like acetyl esterase